MLTPFDYMTASALGTSAIERGAFVLHEKDGVWGYIYGRCEGFVLLHPYDLNGEPLTGVKAPRFPVAELTYLSHDYATACKELTKWLHQPM